jgi:mRNA (guanine-N7-)-methyltransferase
MQKDISEDFVQLTNLSITNLLQCIESSGVKEQFISDIGPKNYNIILRDMRNESTIAGMRDLHNWIKRVLITNITRLLYPKKNIALLDIAVGRGGDLSKWNTAGIKYVFGFDKNEKSINNEDPEDPGAVNRLETFKGSKFKDISFEVGNVLRPNKFNIMEKINTFLHKNTLKGFDIVSCQFAMHYFFKTEVDLRIVLTIVSKYITQGGYFIGTTINGDNIKSLFKDTNEKVYSTEIFRIQRNFPKTPKTPFGNEYLFTIFDTKDKTNYFNTTGVSTEYLVNFKTLESVAAEFGLVPVKLNLFEEYTTGKKKGYVEIKKNTIPFADILKLGVWKPKEDRDITTQEKELNKLYTTFVFQKM